VGSPGCAKMKITLAKITAAPGKKLAAIKLKEIAITNYIISGLCNLNRRRVICL